MRFALASFGLCVAALGSAGCRGDDGEPGPGAGPTGPYGYCWQETPGLVAAAGDPTVPAEPLSEEPVPGSACNAVVRSYETSAGHTDALCVPVEYSTNPPSSGRHYGYWPAYKVYTEPVPRGFSVHSLEHGGVVISYACQGCAAEVADATELAETYPVATLCCSASGCDPSQTNQIILTPDPGLDTSWAAAAWGYTLTADCFEREVFEAFVLGYRNLLAPEPGICSNGSALDVSMRAP